MDEIVETVTYQSIDIDKVEVETQIDNPNGIETKTITIYLEDGSFRVYSLERKM